MNALEQYEDRTLLIVDDDEPFSAGLRGRWKRGASMS